MKRQRLRQLAALGLLVLLSASAGCTGMFGMGDQGLSINPSKVHYDWNTNADVTLDLRADQYRAIYDLNQRHLTVYTNGMLGIKEPIDIGALKYRYPNGTVITLHADESDSFYVEESQKKTTIHLPGSDGKVAFVTRKSPRSITKSVFVEPGGNDKRSYEVIIPPNTGVSLPLVASVHPGGFETEMIDNRVHILWNSVESSTVSVRYYLLRDLYIFGGIAAILTVVGLVGAGYYAIQIRKLSQLRKQVGLSVETDDDSP
jgi:hypothetical protein